MAFSVKCLLLLRNVEVIKQVLLLLAVVVVDTACCPCFTGEEKPYTTAVGESVEQDSAHDTGRRIYHRRSYRCVLCRQFVIPFMELPSYERAGTTIKGAGADELSGGSPSLHR